jgi:hypothetical protein
MILRRFFSLGLPLIVVFALSSAAQARLLHESARIAVYSTEAEAGNRNSHPITVEADQLSAALARVRVRSAETGESIELFPQKNRVEAAAQLAKELRRIDPDQELHLVSFRRVGTLFSSKRNASAARLFLEKGRLNLIFGQIDQFFSEFRDPDRAVPPMGSRKQAALLKAEIIPTEGVTFVDGRNDWVALDLLPAAPAQPAVAPQEKSIEEKLQILKDLRDKELITEQEYLEKKRQILDDL